MHFILNTSLLIKIREKQRISNCQLQSSSEQHLLQYLLLQ